MRILMWHVHGAWTDAIVRGRHEYLLPATPDGGPWGLGRGGRDWPEAARELAPEELRDLSIDAVILQRMDEIDACEQLTGRRPGRDLPAIYVEHNTPKGDVPTTVHPLADRDDIPLVHVTAFNDLMWDSGRAPTRVIEHGVVDPGHRYDGDLPTLGVVVNEPVRRWRVAGTDLLPRFAQRAPLEVFGMGGEPLPEAVRLAPDRLIVHGDLPTTRLHERLAHCRVYLHPFRWTSLGLALIEAMHLGMPVVALATTEAVRAVPPEAGAISTDVEELAEAAARLVADPDEARRRGAVARDAALARYGLQRFLDDWDDVLASVARPGPARAPKEGILA